MFDRYDILLGGGAPLAVSILAFSVGWAATRRAGVAWSSGVLLGYAAGVIAVAARGTGVGAAARRIISPAAAHDWTPLLALLALAPSVALALPASWRGARWLAAAIVSAAAPVWLLWGGKYLPSRELRDAGFQPAWSTPQAMMVLAGVAATLLAAWFMWDSALRQAAPRGRSLLAVFAIMGAAAMAGLTSSLVYAQLFGVLAAAVGGCAVVAWIVRANAGPEAAAGPVILVAGSLLLLAACYSELRWPMAVAIAAAIVLSAGRIPGLRRLGSRSQLAVRTMLCLTPLAIVLWQAGVEFAETQRQQGEAESNPYLSL